MPKEIALFDGILVHVNHGIHPLSGKAHDRGLNFLALLLISRAFGSLWRAREDAVCGYPVQCLTLCRSALEDWGTVLYVERHPDLRGLWLRGVLEEVQTAGKLPRFKDIWADLGQLGQRAEEAYGVLSLFSHPRDRGLPWLYHWDPETTYLHVGGHFDQRDLTVCLYFLIVVAQMFLERAAQLQFRVVGDVDAEWVRRGNEISEEASTFMNRVHDDVMKRAP